MKTFLRYASALLLACTFAVFVTACTESDDNGDDTEYVAPDDTTGSDTTGTGG